MAKKVVSVTEDMPIEEAARIMADNKIGGLPVVSETRLVGIVTETDLFRALLELLGGRRAGVRVTVQISGVKGTFAKVANIVAEAGGNIVGLGVNEVSKTPNSPWHMALKVQDITKDTLVSALEKSGFQILDVREIKG